MRTAKNYSVAVEPYGKEHECDLFSCFHCQRQVFVPPGASAWEIGGGCRICNQLICSKCVEKGTCTPWEEQMLAIERKAEHDRMVSRLVGR
jgi:hypothetical protein